MLENLHDFFDEDPPAPFEETSERALGASVDALKEALSILEPLLTMSAGINVKPRN